MSSTKTSVLRSVAELEALSYEWPALAAQFGTPLLDHDWFACAAAAFHRELDLRIVVVRQDGALAGVAPMATDGKNRLVLIGSPVLHEPSGWVYSSEAALGQLMAVLVQMGHVIMLGRVPTTSTLCHLLPRMTRWQGVTISRQSTESFGVPTNVSWQSYCDSLSSPTRQKLSRLRLKAVREYGDVRFVRMNPQPHEIDEALSLLISVEAGGWKGREGSALATRPELLKFFRSYVARAAKQGRVRISVLWMGDVPAAVELGVECYGRMWGLKLAYDERMAAVAPALQLVHESIAATNAAGLQAYEFLGSAESWQERWHPERRRYHLAAVYPFGTGPMLTACRDAVAHISRRVPRPFGPHAASA